MLERKKKRFFSFLGKKGVFLHICVERSLWRAGLSLRPVRDRDVRAWEGIAECLPGKLSVWAQVWETVMNWLQIEAGEQ